MRDILKMDVEQRGYISEISTEPSAWFNFHERAEFIRVRTGDPHERLRPESVGRNYTTSETRGSMRTIPGNIPYLNSKKYLQMSIQGLHLPQNT